MSKIGILTPGAMGSTLAYSLKNSGHDVYWASEMRSQKTIENAISIGIQDLGLVEVVYDECDYIFCITRDSGWHYFALKAIDRKYKGVYVDFNGLPESNIEYMTEMFDKSDIKFVDAALRAWPISEHKETPSEDDPAYKTFEPRTMFLSGERALEVQSLFKDNFWKFVISKDSSKKQVLKIAEEQRLLN